MFSKFSALIEKELKKLHIETKVDLLTPPRPDLGDFCIVVNKFSKKLDPMTLASDLESSMQVDGIEEISSFSTGNKKKKGIIFLNFKINNNVKNAIHLNFIKSTLKHVFSKNYSYLRDNEGKNAIVEHTSANPISPLHVGNIRNSVHGDTFARILERSGYKVFRHFYVNDVGLQVSFVVIGYEILKKKKFNPTIKFDIWLGQVYAIMNCLYTIQSLKRKNLENNLKIEENYEFLDSEINVIDSFIRNEKNLILSELKSLDSSNKPSKEEKNKIRQAKTKLKKVDGDLSELHKYVDTFNTLQFRFPEMFQILFEEVSKIDLIKKQTSYLRKYEKKSDPRIVTLFKEVTTWALDSFEWTLKRYNIEFDQFDFESEVSWSGLPSKLINKLAKSEYTTSQGGESLRMKYTSEAISNLLKAAQLEKKDLPIKGEVPDLQLRRANGTALYAAKDIAYSVKKFEDRDPHIVYNVISTEQTLPQFQLLLPLVELGYPQYAKGLKHYAYELVDLSGRPMSGRMASYVTADAFYDETYIRSRMAKRVSDSKRNIRLPKDQKEWDEEDQILKCVTIASIRFPLIDKSPMRRIVLDLDKELDFKRNPGPFLQYAHARCNGIIRNTNKLLSDSNTEIDESMLIDDFTISLISHLYNLGTLIRKSIKNQDPSIIANWVFQLAQLFMKYYELYPVSKVEDQVLMRSRLQIIQAIKKGLFVGLDILGIPATERL